MIKLVIYLAGVTSNAKLAQVDPSGTILIVFNLLFSSKPVICDIDENLHLSIDNLKKKAFVRKVTIELNFLS